MQRIHVPEVHGLFFGAAASFPLHQGFAQRLRYEEHFNKHDVYFSNIEFIVSDMFMCVCLWSVNLSFDVEATRSQGASAQESNFICPSFCEPGLCASAPPCLMTT
jgi:hypothetical protein